VTNLVRHSAWLAAALLPLATTACALTTYESPAESPQGAVQPIWPPLGEAPAESPEASQGSPAGETAARPETIGARHILIMYRGSMRAPDTIARSKEEARTRAEEALKRARAGDDFAKLVQEYSDEPGAKQRGGSLGRFPRGVMVKEFEHAAFALEPGEISDIVESPFGFHIIQRTE
jgi:NIMA-interacting peptidyl-prolyl cis-trans isomerase 1